MLIKIVLSCTHLLECLEVEVDYINVFLLTVLDAYHKLQVVSLYSCYILNLLGQR